MRLPRLRRRRRPAAPTIHSGVSADADTGRWLKAMHEPGLLDPQDHEAWWTRELAAGGPLHARLDNALTEFHTRIVSGISPQWAAAIMSAAQEMAQWRHTIETATGPGGLLAAHPLAVPA